MKTFFYYGIRKRTVMVSYAAFHQRQKIFRLIFFQRFPKHAIKTQIYLLNLEKKNLLPVCVVRWKPKGKKNEQQNESLAIYAY